MSGWNACRGFFCRKEQKAHGTLRLVEGHLSANDKVVLLNINDLQTKADVLQWYIDFNSGGVVHTDEEIERVKKLLKKERKK